MASEAASEQPKKPESNDAKPPPPPKDDAPAPKSKPTEGSPKQTATESAPPPAQSRELAKGDRIFASPVAKKIALERGIPLAKVKGTGPEGRILREDVEKYKPEAGAASAGGASQPSASSPAYEDTPVSGMRRTIGQRLTASKQDIPHYYLTVDIDMDKVLKLRQVFNKSLAEKEGGAKLSVNDFIVKATSCALADVPEANSAWLGETIRT
jgi:pyruvate dehydrogenase E2 component (dihydrolipoamide acetyltransferase)